MILPSALASRPLRHPSSRRFRATARLRGPHAPRPPRARLRQTVASMRPTIATMPRPNCRSSSQSAPIVANRQASTRSHRPFAQGHQAVHAAAAVAGEALPAMHGAAIVPDHQIADLPGLGPGQLVAVRRGPERIEQRLAVLEWQRPIAPGKVAAKSNREGPTETSAPCAGRNRAQHSPTVRSECRSRPPRAGGVAAPFADRDSWRSTALSEGTSASRDGPSGTHSCDKPTHDHRSNAGEKGNWLITSRSIYHSSGERFMVSRCRSALHSGCALRRLRNSSRSSHRSS